MRIDCRWLLSLLLKDIDGGLSTWVYHHFIWHRWLKTYWKAPWDERWMRRDRKKAREIKREQAASKQHLSTLNKTFVCDWGFPIRAAWPLLWRSLWTQIPSLSCFLSLLISASTQPIHIAWEQIFLTTWVIDLYKAWMFSPEEACQSDTNCH